VGGLSLVERSILHAKMSRRVDRIVVTSEDREILEHAEAAGAETVKRPDELATDTASGDAVMIHALREAGVESGLGVFLQPTSPLRPVGIIDKCIFELEFYGYDSVFTAWEGHFIWYLYQENWNPFTEGAIPPPSARPLLQSGGRKMRQQIPRTQIPQVENGSVYVTDIEKLVKANNRVCGLIGIVTMEREDSIDIDTEYDLWIAERRLEYLTEQRDARRGERLSRMAEADA